jgi:hypothetical protein
MTSPDFSSLFKEHSKAFKLAQLLSDQKPRTAQQIKAEINLSSISSTANRANEKLEPFNLKVMKIYHPFTKIWEWFLIEKGGKLDVS